MTLVWRRQQEQERLAAAEVAVARALGLHSVFAGPHLSLSHAYLQFLEVCP
jgi:hypothetical protein